MIIIGNMKSLNLQYDELWFIMRSMDWFYKKKVPHPTDRSQYTYEINQKNYQLLMQSNVHIVDELAPSKDLYTFYLLCKDRGTWNYGTFAKQYVPVFIHEMSSQVDSRDKLNELWSLDKQGKTILLVCACQEEHICHRSIIAGLLHSVGCNVTSAFGTNISEYDKYYEMYKYNKYKNNIKN